MDFVTLLAEEGLIVVTDSFSDNKASFVRDVCNEIKAGSSVVVLTHDASDDLLALLVEKAETAENTVVMQNHDTKRKGRNKGSHYSAKELSLALDRRNGQNPSAPGDTWANFTIAKTAITEDGNAVGFMVNP